ncbi:MAG: class IV adenylate cyclase [Aeropyrum sp.]|nr:class IV adenylate cyclase [Aeropyrum sp.]MCE4616002.1 class IV adenylate cyclase [Aeropyrum sp.]
MGRVEVEAKFSIDCKDLETIASRLKDMGFEGSRVEQEIDVYLDHPCYSVVERDEAIRVRLYRDYAMITYKGPRMSSKVKARFEVEARLASTRDGEAIIELLERLGFKSALKIIKRRIYFRSSTGLIVSLDRVENLGCFVEIEGSESEIRRLSRVLGLEGKEVEKTYVELLLESMGGFNP